MFLLFLSIFSFLNPFNYFRNDDLPQSSETAYRVVFESGESIAKKYHMKLCGVGLKENEKIEEFDICLISQHPVDDIDQVRILIYNIIKDHYDNIRTSVKIQPYLISPFSMQNVAVEIIFRTEDGRNVLHPNIETARYHLGDIRFCTLSNDSNFNYKSVIREDGQYFFDIVEGRVPVPVYHELQEGDS